MEINSTLREAVFGTEVEVEVELRRRHLVRPLEILMVELVVMAVVVEVLHKEVGERLFHISTH
jgi:hypothetical protein